MSLLSEIGLDDEEFTWTDLALCQVPKGTPNKLIEKRCNDFFDTYEEDDTVPAQVDQMCLHWPVAKICLRKGIESKSWGVFGGVYLVNGKPDKQENSHKTLAIWKQLEKVHGRSVKPR